MKFRNRSQQMDLQKRPKNRLRTAEGDAEDVKADSVKNMTHEETSKIQVYLRMVLRDGVRVMHVKYVQENKTELLTPRNHKKALKEQLSELGFVVKRSQSALYMQFKGEENVDKRERRNDYCEGD